MHFICILWILLLVVFNDAQKAGEEGVCIKMLRVPKTRVVSYQVTGKCNDGRSICTKTMTKSENYLDEQPVPKCCDSYVYNAGIGKCVPECEDGCEGGTCVAPNVCVCNPPLVLHKTTESHRCAPPVCDNPCVNGVCTANNQCTCSDGYQLKEDNFTCVAQCTNCEHGECISPNVCNCSNGYFNESGQCVPQCDDCHHGFCAAPDNCICDFGYELKNKKCDPICDKPCANAKCVSPNTCECFKGFQAKDGQKETCTPKCESCAHGICSAPNKCECHEGYKLSGKDCEPTCKATCINGFCTSPNECSCKEGYIQDGLNSTVCRKPCSSCNYGTCSLEGVCICQPEMELVNGTCVLITPGELTRTTTGLASLTMTWWVGGAVGLLLMVLVLVAISRIWHIRKDFSQKSLDDGPIGSVAYTLPNTLMRGDDLNDQDEEPNDALLTKGTSVV